MDRERASFAARARPLPPSNGPGFSFEKVQVPLVIFVESCHRHLPAVNHNFPMRGAQLARLPSMINLSAANLIGGLVFGSIGFVAFIYGKRMNLWKPMFLGIALMIYPYFVSNDIAMIAIGAVGTAGLFFLR